MRVKDVSAMMLSLCLCFRQFTLVLGQEVLILVPGTPFCTFVFFYTKHSTQPSRSSERVQVETSGDVHSVGTPGLGLGNPF